jgi:hypothetical protein
MPSITTASKQITNFPFKYIVPFKNDAVAPLYSSIPIIFSKEECLPCSACGSFNVRNKIIQQNAQKFINFIPDEINVKVGISEASPIPPPPPPPPPPPANIYTLFVTWE